MGKNVNEILLSLVLKNKGNWEGVYKDINDKIIPPDLITNCPYVSICDEKYPQALKNAYKPPFVLFYKGNLDLAKDSSRIIYVNGSNNTTLDIINGLIDSGYYVLLDNDYKNTLDIVDLSKVILVSNLDLCEDTLITSPIGNISFEIIKKGGLVLTTCPYGVSTDNQHLYSLMSGLSSCSIYDDIKAKSSIIAKITYDVSLNGDVYVLPKEYGSKYYNNDIIQSGANIFISMKSFLNNNRTSQKDYMGGTK